MSLVTSSIHRKSTNRVLRLSSREGFQFFLHPQIKQQYICFHIHYKNEVRLYPPNYVSYKQQTNAITYFPILKTERRFEIITGHCPFSQYSENSPSDKSMYSNLVPAAYIYENIYISQRM